ncbi:MAG TPA: radical SAM protein [Pyrinomonadaceae bacterium]|nr:radical SAM protein [Pyrinomonadaceae bacterium]
MINLVTHNYRRVYEGVNYRLRTAAGGRLSTLCRPTSIALLMTERCNARCIHCDIWKNRGREDRPTSDQWKTLLSDLRRWLGPVHVVMTGGEALLNPDTVDLVAHGSSKGLFIEVLSHGYWQDQSMMERLALARPGRITISLDGLGPAHDRVRGRESFGATAETSILTLRKVRREQSLPLKIRLKTVIMQQNLDDVCDVAWFAKRNGLEVFYQPIEQTYNTAEDPHWFQHCENWPTDTARAVAVVNELLNLKQQGLPIKNTINQLEVMIDYFTNPHQLRLAVRSHTAHEARLVCAAMTSLQIQANGDVRVCLARGPVGNIRSQPIREIWNSRPRWWLGNCCLPERNLSAPGGVATGTN